MKPGLDVLLILHKLTTNRINFESGFKLGHWIYSQVQWCGLMMWKLEHLVKSLKSIQFKHSYFTETATCPQSVFRTSKYFGLVTSYPQKSVVVSCTNVCNDAHACSMLMCWDGFQWIFLSSTTWTEVKRYQIVYLRSNVRIHDTKLSL